MKSTKITAIAIPQQNAAAIAMNNAEIKARRALDAWVDALCANDEISMYQAAKQNEAYAASCAMESIAKWLAE